MTGEGKSTRGTKEKKYEQNIQGVVLNGKNKGKKVSFSHEYTYTGMLKQGYHKGGKSFPEWFQKECMLDREYEV